jgi:UDP-glucose:(heptosyl)LPS alpha-1,3-glucosyltransferase
VRRAALAIFRLTPAGGLEQHCLRLAEALAARGWAVTLVTTRPPAGALPAGLELELIAQRGRTNHGRLAAFAADAARALAGRFERTVVFHAVPGFDVIFCADPSRAAPGPLRRWLPRYAAYARLERAAFGPGPGLALMLSSAQREGFLRNTGAAPERLALLPPTVDRRRVGTEPAQPRAEARQALGLAAEDSVWLWIGLQPRTKGLDRAMRALAAAPGAQLLVLGLDPASRGGRSMRQLAARLGVAGRVGWLGFASDAGVRQALAAADLLVHPSRADVTGTVILEALAAGVPVITTAVCGYGEHVARAEAGIVLPEPFRHADLAAALAAATPDARRLWSANALAYARRDELYSGIERAADLIATGSAAAAPPGPARG